MYSRANQDPQSISLTTKTSVYPNLVVPPHSVWEANQQGTGSREGNQQRVPTPVEINFIVSRMTELSLTNVFVFERGAELRITQLCMRKHTACCWLQTSTANPYSRETSPVFGFWFLVYYAATQLATQLRQRCIHVVRSNKEARKRLTESNANWPRTHECGLEVVLFLCFVLWMLFWSRHSHPVQ